MAICSSEGRGDVEREGRGERGAGREGGGGTSGISVPTQTASPCMWCRAIHERNVCSDICGRVAVGSARSTLDSLSNECDFPWNIWQCILLEIVVEMRWSWDLPGLAQSGLVWN